MPFHRRIADAETDGNLLVAQSRSYKRQNLPLMRCELVLVAPSLAWAIAGQRAESSA
jgi:hypothetical protein